jgi:hypothetical protein
MKKVINLLGAILITGSVSAQWTYEKINNGFDEPYNVAYTETDNGAFLKLENIDTSVVFFIKGGYYCDDNPKVDIVFVVNGVDKKYSFTGQKSTKNNVVFFTWTLDKLPNLLAYFKDASSIKIRINESYCTTEIYNFNMSGSKAAYEFIKNNNK